MQAVYSSVQVRSLENIHMSLEHANQTGLGCNMTFIDDITAFKKQVSLSFVIQNVSFRYCKLNAQRNRCFFPLLPSLSHRLPLSERVC